jgi:opacity protein-like surface antigen
MNRSALLFASLLFAISVSATAARAEGFVDLRVGGAFTDDGDVDISAFGTTFASGEADFDDSVTGGMRGGYWFESLPWLGLAADVSYFAPDSGSADFDVIPVTPMLMLRVPVRPTEEFPGGRLQPFVGVGPGIFISSIDDDANQYSDDALDVGVDLHAGLKFMATHNIGLFLEYRFTSFEADFSDTVPAAGVPVDVDVDFDTHHVGGGVAFHF